MSSTALYPVPTGENSTIETTGFPTSYEPTGSPTSSDSGEEASLSLTTPYPLPTANATTFGTGSPISSESGAETSLSDPVQYPTPSSSYSTSEEVTAEPTSSASGGETSLANPISYPIYSLPETTELSETNLATSTADGETLNIKIHALLIKSLGLTQPVGATSTPSTFATFTGTAPGSSSLVRELNLPLVHTLRDLIITTDPQ